MEFLKSIFGDKPLTYDELIQAINAHNGNEANKEQQIKIANLGGGEYVGKAKYDALQALFDGQKTELESANTLIADLKKGTKGNEELQGKITGYETQVADLQNELAATKVKSALKVALMSEKAVDVEYLIFKVNEMMKEQGKTLELDESENIKGWNDLATELKIKHPTQFAKETQTKVIPNKLPDNTNNQSGYTKSDILKMPYTERNKLYEENPETYNAAMKS